MNLSITGIRKTNILWKGLTFKQVVSTLKKNNNTATFNKSFFRALPLKIYRKTIEPITTSTTYNERTNLSVNKVIEQPSGANKTVVGNCLTSGIEIYTDPHLPNSTYEMGDCIGNNCNVNAVNAQNRVRSSGNIRKKNYNQDYKQYLQNRNKSFTQNQFNYLTSGSNLVKPGSPESFLLNNIYVPEQSTQCNNTIAFKPSNWKFSSQGGVTSSSQLNRVKYDTLQKVAYRFNTQYGKNSGDYKTSTTNGGSFAPYNGTIYTNKDKYNLSTPSITRKR